MSCEDCFGTGVVVDSDGRSARTCSCSGQPPKAGRFDHSVQLLRVGSKVAWIDEGLIDVIEVLWRAGIDTIECCQHCRDGRGYITFLGGTTIRFPGIGAAA